MITRNSAFRFSLALTALLLAIVPFTLAHAQTFHVLHTFSGGGDGGTPSAGLTVGGGNLYGTTMSGASGNGTVFKLSHSGSGWVLNTLYTFQGGNDGSAPIARVLFGTDGALYGTTSLGGFQGYGTVFQLRPPVTACRSVSCPWSETVLYRFQGGSDGLSPQYGDLAFDSAGNVYGTTNGGGLDTCEGDTCGVVFKLTRSGSSWTESLLYSFTGANDGGNPFSGVIFDGSGNLYGSAYDGGDLGSGTVYELSPDGSGWTQKTLTDFSGGSGFPVAGLTFDAHGNLFGTGFVGGTVYQLQPSGGNWTFSLLESFDGYDGPFGSLTFDAAGNIYGTNATGGAYDNGFVFKMTPSGSSWTLTDLYDFTGGNDGGFPICNVVLDSSGNLYGTAYLGGAEGAGVIWQITP
ncbi:MAG: choice-of-anchor tandem repeat GloVer-containing protein [Candidatus Korobacteraceae bacterium]